MVTMQDVCPSGLRNRLLALVLIAVSPLVVLMFYLAAEQKQQDMAEYRNRVLQAGEIAAHEEEQTLDATIRMLAGLAAGLGTNLRSAPDCAHRFDPLLAGFHYAAIGLADPDGSLVCGVGSVQPGSNLRGEPWFRQAKATKAAAVGEAGPGPNRPAVIGYPVIDPGGRPAGVVFAALDLQATDRAQSQLAKELPPGSAILQVDENGLVLSAHSGAHGWGSTVPVPFPFEAGSRESRAAVATLSGPNGEPYVVAAAPLFSTLRGRRVYVLVAVPQKELFAKANRHLAHQLVLLGSVGLLAVLAAWLSGEAFVLRQIRALLTATRRVAGGDLSTRTRLPKRAGELNELANAFDEMASRLQQRELERETAEAWLRASREELRKLTAHLQSAREEERTGLAREIHDELGQALTALKMDLAWITKRLEPPGEPLRAKVRAMDELVDETIRIVHRLSGELRPGILDDLGLAAAVEWQAEEFQRRAEIPCRMSIDLGNVALSRDHATTVFRIFQETLTNIMRHARATRVEGRLEARDGLIELVVRDNGVGITREQAGAGTAYGLIGMRERAVALRGRFAVTGEPGGGTTVSVGIPTGEEQRP